MPGRYDLQPEAAQPRTRILVVDDDEPNLKVMRAYLTLDGYEVLLASDGYTALERLSREQVDLVVLDIRMPGLDGIEVCRRIREDPRNARLPVMFLTADQGGEEREFLGLEVGGDEYLHKPISRRVLSARVKSLLRLASAERERQLMGQMAHNEKLAAIGQVAAGVAHEINNPLSFILSNLESLKSYFDDMVAVLQAYDVSWEAGRAASERLSIAATMADIGPLIAETALGGRRVRSIVQELKTFSRSDGGVLEAVDLAEVARSTLLLTERELSLHATLEKHLEPAAIDQAPRQKLHQVMLNLVVNAMHAVAELPQGGRPVVRIHTSAEGGDAVLRVSDTGVGIPSQHLTRIFEPFFTTKPVGVGTGLGLSVCQSIVHRLGGRIDVESQVGQGTTFTVRIPRAGQASAPIPQVTSAA